MKSIANHSTLDNPESVREYIAKAKVSESRKCILVDAVSRYYEFKQIPWVKQIYREIQKLLFIPLEREVDDLISGANKKAAAFLLLLKETGLRPGEVWALKWIDLDYERNCLTCTPEKNSNSRQLRITSRLIAMLNQLPKQKQWIFHDADANPIDSLIHFRRAFDKQRTKLSIKLQNPRIR
jgi:integrase